MAQIVYPITFDGTDLSTVPGLTVLATDAYAIPKRSLSDNQIARSNKSKTSLGLYTQRNISVRVGIQRNSRADVELSIDSLMLVLQGIEKDLIVPQSNSLRRYIASLGDVSIITSGGSYIEMTLVFSCADKYGFGLQYEKLLDATGRTLYNYTDPLTFNGSADQQMPVITIFVSALTGAANNTITLTNTATGQILTVNRAWTAGDRLVVDVGAGTVTVNGTAVDYNGAFPFFAPGIGYLNYQDDFSTRTIAISAYYYRRYV